MAENVGWRWIFFASCGGVGGRHADGARHAGEQGRRRAAATSSTPRASLTFMVAMVALQVLATQGGTLGWTSLASVGLLATSRRRSASSSSGWSPAMPTPSWTSGCSGTATYTGATLSNLLLNAVAGIIIVSMTLVQVGGGMSAQEAGLLTLGYAIAIVAVHPGRREAAAALRRAQADDLGLPDRRGGDRAADADQPSCSAPTRSWRSSPSRSSASGSASTPRRPPTRRSRTCRTIRPDPDRASTRWPRRSARPSASRSRPRSSPR